VWDRAVSENCASYKESYRLSECTIIWALLLLECEM
jgi:hypothetical protein